VQRDAPGNVDDQRAASLPESFDRCRRGLSIGEGPNVQLVGMPGGRSKRSSFSEARSWRRRLLPLLTITLDTKNLDIKID
jgi:hypothetical protein